MGANELLALARNGALPMMDAGNSPAGAHVFDAFTAALSGLEPSAGTSIHDLVNIFADGNLTDVTAHGDGAASQLGQPGSATRSSLESAGHHRFGVRALGLDIRGEASRQTVPGKHLELFRVRATPLDGSLVPGLGSRPPTTWWQRPPTTSCCARP